MTVYGTVKNGVVVLETPDLIPEGTRVEVVAPVAVAHTTLPLKQRTLADALESIIGKAEGLPSDYALNLDHYLYGTEKK